MKSSSPENSAAASANDAVQSRIAPWIPPMLLGALFWLLHAFTVARYLTNWDAGQFALGTVRFDLASHQPHPPGYFLFVWLGRLLNTFTHDANTSLVAISGLAGLAAIITLYWTALALSENRRTAIWLTLLLVANPVFWYYGSIANTYTFEALAISITVWCTVRVRQRRSLVPFLVNVALVSLLAGFRPAIVLASAPLLLVQIVCLRKKTAAVAWGLITAALMLLIWLVPMAYAAGGLSVVWEETILQALRAQQTAVYDLGRISFFFWSVLFTANTTLLLGAAFPSSIVRALRAGNWMLLLPIGVMTAVYLGFHFGEVGYLLSLLPVWLLVTAPAITRITASRTGVVVLAAMVLGSGALFLLAPEFLPKKVNQVNYWNIRQHDARISAYLSAVRAHDPQPTLVVALRGQYLRPDRTVGMYAADDIRTLEYYLPAYALVDLLGVPGRYYEAFQWHYQQLDDRTIRFNHDATTMLVLGDYLHPDVQPPELKFTPATAEPSANNVYQADISGLDRFLFLGFTFERK
ncbi:MAG: DUF2723 domain-containing protein [Patescibacteria group bacterium]|nr:DUF2723 domain-containing protein [Patescibacteria group bacterium]